MYNQQNINRTDSFLKGRFLKLIVIGLSSFAVFLLVTLLALVISWYIKQTAAIYQIEKTVCVPCYQITWSGNEELAGFEQRNESDAEYMTCCTRGSKILDRLIEKHATSKHNDLRSTRIIGSLEDECKGKTLNSQKPYSKMTGLNFTWMENDEDNIIRWNSTKYEGNVKPVNGKIFIKEPGFYYVFSNLKLKILISNSSMVHGHEILLHSYYHGTLKPILENSKSFCETTSLPSEIVSTIGGVFQLEKHDKLFVRSSHPQHLVPCEYSNEFGLYMI